MLGRAWTHALEACTDESPPFPVLCTWVGLGWSVLILWSWASDSMSSKGCNEDGMRFCIRRTSVKPGTWWSSPSSLLPPPPASSPSYHHHQHHYHHQGSRLLGCWESQERVPDKTQEAQLDLNFRQTTIITQNSNPTRLRTVIKNFNNYPWQHMEMIE